jgi:hypothetical protein
MINLRQWREYLQRVSELNPEIRSSYFVSTKERFMDITKTLTINNCPVLIGTLPEVRPGTINEDNVSEMNMMELLVLIPRKRADFEAEAEFLNWELCSRCCAQVKEQLRTDYFDNHQYPFLQWVKLKTITQEKEWNFEGFMGWRLAFEIESEGF